MKTIKQQRFRGHNCLRVGIDNNCLNFKQNMDKREEKYCGLMQLVYNVFSKKNINYHYPIKKNYQVDDLIKKFEISTSLYQNYSLTTILSGVNEKGF